MFFEKNIKRKKLIIGEYRDIQRVILNKLTCYANIIGIDRDKMNDEYWNRVIGAEEEFRNLVSRLEAFVVMYGDVSYGDIPCANDLIEVKRCLIYLSNTVGNSYKAVECFNQADKVKKILAKIM